MFWPYNQNMSDKIYTQYDMDKALENAESLAEEAMVEARAEAYEEGLSDGGAEFQKPRDQAAQNGVSPLRDGNLTDCALFILAKRGNRKPCLGEVVAVEAKLQEAGL